MLFPQRLKSRQWRYRALPRDMAYPWHRFQVPTTRLIELCTFFQTVIPYTRYLATDEWPEAVLLLTLLEHFVHFTVTKWLPCKTLRQYASRQWFFCMILDFIAASRTKFANKTQKAYINLTAWWSSHNTWRDGSSTVRKSCVCSIE